MTTLNIGDHVYVGGAMGKISRFEHSNDVETTFVSGTYIYPDEDFISEDWTFEYFTKDLEDAPLLDGYPFKVIDAEDVEEINSL